MPNLLTAGNLTCGFVALTNIVEADISTNDFTKIKVALIYILAACVFDLFDGRVARMGGRESPFGREFDSLADLISFGVAPAFLIHRIVLKDVFVLYPQIGWFIASIYVICGAFRLARFNCLATMAGSGGGKEFLGFPIPSAAGLVGSLTYFMIEWNEKDFAKGLWRYALPALMLFLSRDDGERGQNIPPSKSLDFAGPLRTFTKMLVTIPGLCHWRGDHPESTKSSSISCTCFSPAIWFTALCARAFPGKSPRRNRRGGRGGRFRRS